MLFKQKHSLLEILNGKWKSNQDFINYQRIIIIVNSLRGEGCPNAVV